MYIDSFTEYDNPAMTISSRRYLFTYGCVVKYSGFADKVADSYGLMGVNPNICPPQNPVVVYSEDIVSQKQSQPSCLVDDSYWLFVNSNIEKPRHYRKEDGLFGVKKKIYIALGDEEKKIAQSFSGG